ncbi:hypothetical protein [Tsukamurella columbiensis]|uniref:Uncharacterized protein n=1 Tax=Tsukamurella columbiensis TaxID=128509 RepID=A0ABX1LJ82_9ACTN|nr:hypothetical protein [Tsukamurella columbiensis]NMD58302.1 hypothetical protein [Tsukamurella columbiensis]
MAGAGAVDRGRRLLEELRERERARRAAVENMPATERRDYLHRQRNEKIAFLIAFSIGLLACGVLLGLVVRWGEILSPVLMPVATSSAGAHAEATDVGWAFTALVCGSMVAAILLGVAIGRISYRITHSIQSRKGIHYEGDR